MENPIETLFEEHTIIANALEIAREAAALIGKDNEQYDSTMRRLIVFFREYADGYHHQKEETILFPELAKKSELMAEGIILEMNENHEDFREKIGMIEKCLNEGNYPKVHKIMDRYAEALLDHIGAENDELFQTAGSLLSAEEQKAMYFKFQDCDNSLGIEKKAELIEMASGLRAVLLTGV